MSWETSRTKFWCTLRSSTPRSNAVINLTFGSPDYSRRFYTAYRPKHWTTFTTLHYMQGSLVRRKLSVRLSVCPTVCLSKRMHCDKTEERSVQIFIPYKRSFSQFLRRRMVGMRDHFYLKFWVNRPRLKRNRRF